MKSILAFIFLFSGSVLALDESLSIEKLPVGALIEFNIPRVEMPPLSNYAPICKDVNADYWLYMNYSSAPKERYFPGRQIQMTLVKSIVFSDKWDDAVELCSEVSKSDCEFTFNDDLKDINFQISFGKNRTIADLRKFVEGCGGTMTLPEPTPYP